ncbi:MAG: bifunctional 4-hydroxy-2-oxoglutarate aldolase/2-dehydro-3-deoxy-phosphogluconate aldolase [Anaerolineae bacterium]|nr:bifunctional 4-hydroxy-2-oxoglutarate aldolase/2-dehydro-3-deoxy-phosphogluconate aldolase [Anaerolineae bacterium]
MARFTRLEVYQAMIESGLVPLFYHPDVEVGKQVMEAGAAGGTQVLEFTNRADMAYDVFKQLSLYAIETRSPLILGVGSVVDAPTAAMYIGAGANFIVSPLLNPEVARLCNRHKVPYLPGCATPSEISQAEELGAEIIKIFPGNTVGGPDFVKAILGPCPWTSLMPSGGVDVNEENIRGWIEAGACCLGMGSKLISKSLVASGDYQGIANNITQVLAWIAAARK